ncbi:MAG TPA: heat-inducible transcriptional repressor HrcA [Candidatus Saccharimonadales bacterium]|nr:heat-inducible transcriptional repressor HrcA [Candidatus Saccharimonadales bacterium]
MDIDLGRREQQILYAIVEEHVSSGEPVSSRAISRKGPERISSATVRNTMADLEEQGLLEQPHASSGRVPTELGYRVYVDHLMRRGRVGSKDEEYIQRSLGQPVEEASEMFSQVSRVLSKVSRQVGVVVTPNLTSLRLKHIEFVRLGPRRVVAILVAASGMLHNKVIESDDEYTQEQLDRSGRYLTETFQGLTLPEIRERIRTMMSEERAAYDKMLRDALELGHASMSGVKGEGGVGQVFLDGASNLVVAPEFADVARLQGILRTLDERDSLMRLLTRCIEEGDPGVRVLIGSETDLPDLNLCTLIASTYGPDGSPRGALGVIGPTRMEYAKAVALVDYVSRFFGSLLTRYTS